MRTASSKTHAKWVSWLIEKPLEIGCSGRHRAQASILIPRPANQLGTSLVGSELGRERVITVPVDGQGWMLACAFPELSGPVIVCILAGNVNTGAFDPASEICALAHLTGAIPSSAAFNPNDWSQSVLGSTGDSVAPVL